MFHEHPLAWTSCPHVSIASELACDVDAGDLGPALTTEALLCRLVPVAAERGTSDNSLAWKARGPFHRRSLVPRPARRALAGPRPAWDAAGADRSDDGQRGASEERVPGRGVAGTRVTSADDYLWPARVRTVIEPEREMFSEELPT